MDQYVSYLTGHLSLLLQSLSVYIKWQSLVNTQMIEKNAMLEVPKQTLDEQPSKIKEKLEVGVKTETDGGVLG